MNPLQSDLFPAPTMAQGTFQGNIQELKAAASQALITWHQRAEQLPSPGLRRIRIPMMDMKFDLRGHSAGQCIMPRLRKHPCTIRINAELLERYPEEMIEETVPHEVAHAVVYALWGRNCRPHGAEWQSVMQHFGKEATRTHKMETTAARKSQSTYAYRCQCPGQVHQLGAVRHRRASRGKMRYQCRTCRSDLIQLT